MGPLAYIELKRLIADEPIRLSILKSKYNQVAVKLNGFYTILSEEEIKLALTQIKYYQQQIDTYER
jgi:hypothetical protein